MGVVNEESWLGMSRSSEGKKPQPLNQLASILRVITVPPVLVSALLLLLFALETDVFATWVELLLSLVFLVLIPLAAYPLSQIIPSVKEKGREGQRQLALLLSLAGYAGGVAYGILGGVSNTLLLIFLTYFVSVAALVLFNKALKLRASGHACSSTGPLIFFVYCTGLYGVVPCVVIAAAVAWSSLHLERHTKSELLLGAAIACVSFLVALPLSAALSVALSGVF